MTEDEYTDYVKQLVAQAPPLRPDQISRLSGLFDTPRQEHAAHTRDAKAS